MLTLDKIYHAAFVLRDVARRTDLIAASRLNSASDLYLKTENLQVTGSFKVRGAYYKISQLTAEERAKGVIACSAGNHAQGVALAATSMGIKSVVCMPDGAPLMKVESTKRLGAQVELVKGTYDDAHDRAVELQKETGMTFIHPYDDELVIAGQGTIGLEILDQLPDVEAVVVPVGGGGLLAGVAFAIKSLRPDVKIYGVQAAGAASMYNAYRDHTYETLDHVDTFADGIAVKTPGETTFKMIEQYVDGIVTVSEDEIAAAILALMENQKLVAEGAGATPVAAALFGKLHFAALDVARAHGDVGKTINQCLDAVAGATARKSDVHVGVGLGESFGSLLNHGQNRRGTVDDQITGKRGGRSSNHRSGKAEFLEHLRFSLHCNSMSEGLHRLPLVVSAPTSTEVRPSKFFLRRFSEPQC